MYVVVARELAITRGAKFKKVLGRLVAGGHGRVLAREARETHSRSPSLPHVLNNARQSKASTIVLHKPHERVAAPRNERRECPTEPNQKVSAVSAPSSSKERSSNMQYTDGTALPVGNRPSAAFRSREVLAVQ